MIFVSKIACLRTNSFRCSRRSKAWPAKVLGEASDELVEIRNTAVEVLEHSEPEEEDSALEKVDQGEVGLETTRMHRPDAPQVRAVHLSCIRRR